MYPLLFSVLFCKKYFYPTTTDAVCISETKIMQLHFAEAQTHLCKKRFVSDFQNKSFTKLVFVGVQVFCLVPHLQLCDLVSG